MAARHRLPASFVDMTAHEKLHSARLASRTEAMSTCLIPSCNIKSSKSRVIAIADPESVQDCIPAVL